MEISKELEMANTAFYSALNAILTGDITEMVGLWSHAADVTCLGPAGGLLIGRESVFAAWKHQATLKMQGEVHPEKMHFFEEGNIGIIQCIEIGNHNANGKTQQINIRAINIFRKEEGKWKMISHQTDLWDFFSLTP